MEISPLFLSALTLFSFLWGGVAGVILNINQAIRIIIVGDEKKYLGSQKYFAKIILFVQDVIFTLIVAGGITVINYYFNDGRFRFISFLACFIGYVLYYFTLNKVVSIVIKHTSHFLHNFFYGTILHISRIILFFINLAKKRIEKNINLRYNKKRKEYMINKSKTGYINIK